MNSPYARPRIPYAAEIAAWTAANRRAAEEYRRHPFADKRMGLRK